MKKLVLLALLVASSSALATDESFNVTLTLRAPIVITETHALTFPNTLRGLGDVVVATGDSNAAAFTATGDVSVGFTKSVVESTINMTTGDGVGTTKQIAVDTFTLAGPVAFDGTGNATGLKVGATAHVQAEDIAGNYSGTATFRMIY